MKKRLATISLLILTIMLFICAPEFVSVFAAESDNLVVILSGDENGNVVTVNADLRVNTGVSGLTLQLDYDPDVFVLTNVQRGGALSSLDYMTTGVETEQSYSIMPFKLNWSGDENDTSIGRLFTLSFRLKEGVENGDYRITLLSDRNTVTYIAENTVKTKSVLIDGVKITVKDNLPSSVITDSDSDPKNNASSILFISIILASVAVIGLVITIIILIIKKKGKTSWRRVD